VLAAAAAAARRCTVIAGSQRDRTERLSRRATAIEPCRGDHLSVFRSLLSMLEHSNVTRNTEKCAEA